MKEFRQRVQSTVYELNKCWLLLVAEWSGPPALLLSSPVTSGEIVNNSLSHSLFICKLQ